MSTTPSPAMFANLVAKKQAALVEPDAKAKVEIVRPGMRDVEVFSIHDGVVKAKHLKPGMSVRPYVHGEPRGAERVIKNVSRVGDGANVLIECESGFDPQERPAAYRWYCEALDGATVSRTVKTPALVPYQEV